MQDLHIRELRFRQHREPRGETDKRSEGRQIQQTHDPQMTTFEHRQLLF
ncbi:Uncharacterised protein [Salmonella enterica subsp. enterica serovar Bovismorbificans]|uniref:Uncharacterized protein n=1 Tax=Salmonella enterica subsp. enterica serovar Bovismorbificans TaxID=58097 RepID=A0A655E4J5_SALET|nr:Uncharacterised protein [Salmonella enterica subsp. enterica serovar Bovismorbificans]